jgi:hypothetical protein
MFEHYSISQYWISTKSVEWLMGCIEKYVYDHYEVDIVIIQGKG